MRRFVLFLIVALVVGAVDASAGTVTMDFGNPRQQSTTAAQDAALAILLTRVNAQRVAQGQSAFPDIEAYLLSLLAGTVQSFFKQVKDWERDDACAAYQALAPAEQDTIKTALGGKSPCP